jgi:hypothetical protein
MATTPRDAAMGEAAMAEDDTDVTGDTPAGLGADAPAAEDPIDALLREFEEGTQGTAPKPAFNPDRAAQEASEALRDAASAQRESLAIDSRQAELRVAEQQLMLEQHKRDLADAVSEIRGELPKNLFDNNFIQTWLDAKAHRDPRLQQLWLERSQNPRAMKAALDRLAEEFHSTYGKVSTVDENATVDHEAVTQAVRGQGGKAPPEPPPNFGRMSDNEFRRHVSESYGFDP